MIQEFHTTTKELFKKNNYFYFVLILLSLRPILNITAYWRVNIFKLEFYSFTILTMWSLALIFLLLIILIKHIKLLPRDRIVLLPIIFFIFSFIFNIINYKSHGIVSYFYLMFFFLAFFGFCIFLKKNYFDQAADLFTFFTILLLSIHVVYYFLNPGLQFTKIGGFIGFYGSKHIAATSFFICIPFLFYKYLKEKKIFYLVLLLVTIFCMIFTFQRSAILSLFIVVIVFLLIKKSFKYIFLVLISFLLLFYIMPKENLQVFYQSKFISEYETAKEDNIGVLGAGRLGIMISGLDYYLDLDVPKQIFGAGPGSADYIHLRVIKHLAYSHVQWIQLLID
ncbi:MAG: O-antigen ligase family protein, partial [Candidatus Lokiarchaeota archaeon]|nr:O-antigen ligase family protein [Candidatus Lokiarchaeota archaeon]